jgi:hypothetical protein
MYWYRLSLAAVLVCLVLVTPALAQPHRQSDQATIAPAERQWIAPGSGASWAITLPSNQGGLWDLIVDGPDPRLTLVVTGDGRTLSCEQAPHGGPACYRVPGSIRQFQITISVGGDADGFVQDIPAYINDVNTSGQGIFVGDLKLLVAIGTAPTPTPLLPSPTAGSGGGMPDCMPQQLVSLGVTAPDGRLIAPAATSFQAVREEIKARTGQDVLAILADVLRQPGFTTGKAGVAYSSWHKAGRAVDLNQGGPFRRVQEGQFFRLYVGDVDITAIFAAHGWSRIPIHSDGTAEWWHYEWHPDGIAWTSAMLQVWPLSVLQAAFPDIDWAQVGCMGGGGNLPPPSEIEGTGCFPDGPNWTEEGIGYSRGCGPPLLPPGPDKPEGTQLRQFVGIVGWLGDSGHLWPPWPQGAHLHLALDNGSATDMCRWPNQAPGASSGEPPPGGTQCLTTWADPLQFLPQANGDTLAMAQGTPVPVGIGQAADATLSDAVVQLPPPGHPAGLLEPLARDDAAPGGTWWSPGNDDRALNARCPLGGPQATSWLEWLLALLFPWWFGC